MILACLDQQPSFVSLRFTPPCLDCLCPTSTNLAIFVLSLLPTQPNLLSLTLFCAVSSYAATPSLQKQIQKQTQTQRPPSPSVAARVLALEPIKLIANSLRPWLACQSQTRSRLRLCQLCLCRSAASPRADPSRTADVLPLRQTSTLAAQACILRPPSRAQNLSGDKDVHQALQGETRTRSAARRSLLSTAASARPSAPAARTHRAKQH
ncbi:hypothetical protein J3E68DRAFT_239774 [Trichoderma sp. SZMC 28012]